MSDPGRGGYGGPPDPPPDRTLWLARRAGVVLLALGSLLPLAGGAALPPPRAGDRGCSPATLRGAYGGLGTGTNVSSPLVPQGPLALVNVLVFDGRGGLTVRTETMSFNGDVRRLEVPVAATYTLRPDCTGELRFEAPNLFDMVVLEGGAEVVAIHATPGFVHTVVLKRLATR